MREDRPGDGVVFLNKYKTDGDKKPTLKGHVFHWKTGERIELALWPHRTGGGYSIKCSEPRSLSQEAGMAREEDIERDGRLSPEKPPF